MSMAAILTYLLFAEFLYDVSLLSVKSTTTIPIIKSTMIIAIK